MCACAWRLMDEFEDDYTHQAVPMQLLVDSMTEALEKLNTGLHSSAGTCVEELQAIVSQLQDVGTVAGVYDTNLKSALEREAVLQKKLKNFNSCESMVRSWIDVCNGKLCIGFFKVQWCGGCMNWFV